MWTCVGTHPHSRSHAAHVYTFTRPHAFWLSTVTAPTHPPQPMRPPIRAICFDLDNTLWDVWPVIRKAEERMYDFLAQRYPRVVAALTIEAMREAREKTAA